METYGLTNKYGYRQESTGDFYYFDAIAGVRVLSIDGMDSLGDTVNVYNAQWIDDDKEDFVIAHEESKIVRKNVDINLTLIISRRYTTQAIDEQTVYNSLLSTICDSDIYLYSAYTNKIAHVVCLKSFKPTAVKLHRGRDSYILATIPLHTLEPPTNVSNS